MTTPAADNISPESRENSASPSKEQDSELKNDHIKDASANRLFNDGKSLDIHRANLITSETPTQIIVLAGEIESGKTTLLATIYEKFMNGPFAGFSFSGSQTLLAFEERCHLARIASGQSKPDTSRSSAMDPDLLHLEVRKARSKDKSEINLLFTDISGEKFRMVRDSAEECIKLKILARADHFAILIDGAQLSDKKYRQKAYQDCRALLRSTLDAGMLGKHTYVEVIFSKWDLIQPQKVRTEHTEFVDAIKVWIMEEFGNQFGRLEFFSIASRAQKTRKYPFGYNLHPVFRSWATDTPQKEDQSPLNDPKA